MTAPGPDQTLKEDQPLQAGQPLEGVRVLAVEQYGAGPFGTMYLANQGAEIVKIENPQDGGDMARSVGPYFFDAAGSESQFFYSFNVNKRSIAVNLRSDDGRRVFRELAATADAVTNNLRGDVPEKLGLDYASLRDVNQRLVCAHLSAYGRDGSRRTWPGYDYLMQAEAGWFSVTGEPGTPPSRFGLSVVDMMTGIAMAFGVTSAILAARVSGTGRDVDVSLFDLALHSVTYLSTWYLNAGHVQERLPRSAHPSLTPCQSYRTRDGWIYLMCNKEKFWPALCARLDRPEWVEDARFRTFKDRLAHRGIIQDLLDEALSARTTAEWLAAFGGAVPAAPILGIGAAMDNPFVAERDGIHHFDPPPGVADPFRLVAHPIRNAGVRPPTRPAPAFGADTDALLGELGYRDRDIEALRKTGAVG